MFCEFDQAEVVRRFEAFRSTNDRPVEGGVIDYFGTVTTPDLAPYLAPKAGTRLSTPPYPRDGIRAGFIEYLALVDSVIDAGSVYQMTEIGASYAPFTAIAGQLALRDPARKVSLRPVEAAKKGIDAIERNLVLNGIFRHPNADVRVTNAAVSPTRGTLYFPGVDSRVDNGGAASAEAVAVDYRGGKLSHIAVQAVTVGDIFNTFDQGHPVDFVHMDIQGAEGDVIPATIELLNARVRRIMVATHSRLIEGRLLELFHANGWKLVAEEPVLFRYREAVPTLTGMTTKDGAMYWVNKRLAS